MLHILLLIYLYSALAVMAEYPVLKYIYEHDKTAKILLRTHHFDSSKQFGTILFIACLPLINTFMALQTLAVIVVCSLNQK